MKIGILGSGDVGLKLADAFVAIGHIVKIGTRSPNKIAPWLAERGAKVSVGSFADAALFGELITLATLWEGTANAIKIAGVKNFSGKVLVDVTNPLDFSKGMPPRLTTGRDDSGGETVQRLLPDARVVKALNIVGNMHMFQPEFPGGPPTMFVCGNDDHSKKSVLDILGAFGWETVDIGGIEGSRLLEPLAMLWIMYYLKTGTGNHAFKLLRK
jgi:8-hydroxy-5-deazaflavin:NADPH oxidoreductase